MTDDVNDQIKLQLEDLARRHQLRTGQPYKPDGSLYGGFRGVKKWPEDTPISLMSDAVIEAGLLQGVYLMWPGDASYIIAQMIQAQIVRACEAEKEVVRLRDELAAWKAEVQSLRPLADAADYLGSLWPCAREDNAVSDVIDESRKLYKRRAEAQKTSL